MISREVSKRILTVGCYFKQPRGGIAQVLWNYQKYLFEDFNYVVNSKNGPLFYNLLLGCEALLTMCHLLLWNRNISIVHIHTASYNSFMRSVVFASLAKLFNKKVIYHIHGGGFKKFAATATDKIAKKLQKADAVIVLSDSWRKFFVEDMGCKKVYVLNNVIAPPQISQQRNKGRVLNLLFLGLITQRKGIFELLEALKLCLHDRENVELHIAGNGEVDLLKQKIVELGVQDNVFYHGWVADEEKANLLNQCDLFVLPSYVEGLPVSIVEAMSYGMPVVATSVGAIPEVVADGCNGAIIQPGDTVALAAFISRYAQSRDLLDAQAKNAKATAQRYLPEYVASGLESIYNSLLNVDDTRKA